MVKMVKPDRLSFEKFTAYVEDELPKVDKKPKVWDAFLKWSQLDDSAAKDALGFGNKPFLFVADLGSAYGFFHPSKPHTINIGRKLVLDFETPNPPQNIHAVMEATILHELVHWALNGASIPEEEGGQPVEMGVEFEREAYGAPVLSAADLIHDQLEEAKELGTLSRRFESGGNPGAIGVDRNGGWSYGLYQLASKQDQVRKFMAFLAGDPRWGHFAQALEDAGGDRAARAGTEAFKEAWRGLATEAQFARAQHDYIKATHYDRYVAALKELGLDLSKRSSVLQDVAWSVSVQHGPSATGMFMRSFNTLRPELRKDDKALIKAIYDDRSRVEVHFRSSKPSTRASVKKRFAHERAEALKRLTA